MQIPHKTFVWLLAALLLSGIGMAFTFWSFVQIEGEPRPHYVCLETGFEPGKVYQIVYTTRGSSIVGLGFVAVRDIVSFLKYAAATDGNPCAGTLDYAYAFGASQSGRFLRQMIHLGLNEDEAGRNAQGAQDELMLPYPFTSGEELLAMGVDGIFTDRLDLVAQRFPEHLVDTGRPIRDPLDDADADWRNVVPPMP